MITDLHVHTSYSFDSKVAMEDYIQLAIQRGLGAICFTDHIECGEMFHSFTTFDFAGRAELFHTLKAKYGNQIELLLGVEFGEPHLYPKELSFIHTLELDMIIGSVHYPMDLWINHREGRDGRYFENLYGQYVLDMVNHGGFDVVGHIDMPKRYIDDYQANIPQLQKILRTCVDNNLTPEVNVSSTHRMGLPPMPDMDMVSYYQSIGGKYITVNSDSHKLADIGATIPSIITQLPNGIKRCYFKNRQLVQID